MEIKVLGSGCANCQTLQKRAEEAVKKAGIKATVTKVTDYDEMLSYGILRTPGLVIEGKLVLSGRLPSADEIAKILEFMGETEESGIESKSKEKTILFVCTGNAFRSQIAEGFARKLFPKGWKIYSAGTMAAGLSKTAAEAMREIGIDISGQYSKTLHDVPCDKVDYVVTLCDHAQARCPVFPKIKLQEHWPIADPLSATGVEPIEAVRKTRDEIGQRMKDLVKRIA